MLVANQKVATYKHRVKDVRMVVWNYLDEIFMEVVIIVV